MTTMKGTADYCDEHGDELQVCEPIFQMYGGRHAFAGPVSTVRCFEDNSRVKEAVESPGQGRVLVVDGGGSRRRALFGGNLGSAAVKNGWAGVIIYGCIRDSAELGLLNFGIRALGTMPNTYADVKAECDICCTSSNAVAVVESLKSDTVIFLPDEYLAKNVARETGCHVIVPTVIPKPGAGRAGTEVERTMIAWKGRCEVHELLHAGGHRFGAQAVSDVMILAHPECRPEVVEKADYSGSTTAMIAAVQRSGAKRFLLLTECSMGDNIVAALPDKEMLRLCSVRCPHMTQITLEDTLLALQRIQYVVEVPEEIRLKALKSVERG